MRGSSRLLLLVAAMGAGCVAPIADHTPRLGRVVDDCLVTAPWTDALPAPVSLELPSGSLWLWSELSVDDAVVHNAAALVESGASACGGELALLTDDAGAPRSLLPLTAEEDADNASRADGRRLALEPTGGFVSDGRGTLYYERALLGPGFFDREVLGTGVCRLDGPDAECTRLPGRGRDDGLVWGPGERAWSGGGAVADDGRAILVGCARDAAFTSLCGVARVPVDEVDDPAAYEVKNAFAEGGWTTGGANADTLFASSGRATLRRDEWLGRWAVLGMDLWGPRVEAHLAREPGGAYEAAIPVFDPIPPADWFVEGGSEHAALGPADGRELVFSYGTNPTGAASELHLVRVRLGGGAR